jgi:hypothetical protein
MPPGFRDVYQSFWQSGWPTLAHWILPEFDMRLAIIKVRLQGIA